MLYGEILISLKRFFASLRFIFVYFNQISVYFSFTNSNYFPFFKLIPYLNPLSLHIA